MRLPKILVVSEEWRGGGALKRIIMVAEHLKDNVDFILCFPSEAAILKDQCQEKRLRYELLDLSPLTRHTKGLWRYIWTFIPDVRRLYHYIKEEKPDIVHANSSWQFKAIIASRLSRTPSIWHMNDAYQARMVILAYRILSRWSNYRIYASRVTHTYYKPYDKHVYGCIIPAPVKINYDPASDRRDYASALRIMTVAYINPNKGIHIMIEAISHLVYHHGQKDAQLTILGPVLESQKGYYNSLCEQVIGLNLRDHVTFKGYTEDVESEMYEADYYVCASEHESSPMAVWEAMANGLPVISSDIGDLRSMNKEKECCMICDRNPAAIAHAIMELKTDSARRNLLSDNAYQHIKHKYSIERHTNLYLQFCREILEMSKI